MNTDLKVVDTLTPMDLDRHAVWEYVNDNSLAELVVRPVKVLPVQSLAGRLVETHVRLANGEAVWALIGNVDCADSHLNQHFLTISIRWENQWFTLARYFDIDYSKNGPDGLAKFLNSSIDEVFPIAYDLRFCAEGTVDALVGSIDKEPRERLSRAALMTLAVP